MYKTLPYKTAVTAEQYANAKKHWEALIAGNLQLGFNMANYVTTTKECGTVACSAGQLPYTLDIPEIVMANYGAVPGISTVIMGVFRHVAYVKLCRDFLGIPGNNIMLAYERPCWDWCFSAVWKNKDNTAKGAGIRMRILYEEGLPAKWSEMLYGRKPLMYEEELKRQ